jgi:hypothetical protein
VQDGEHLAYASAFQVTHAGITWLQKGARSGQARNAHPNLCAGSLSHAIPQETVLHGRPMQQQQGDAHDRDRPAIAHLPSMVYEHGRAAAKWVLPSVPMQMSVGACAKSGAKCATDCSGRGRHIAHQVNADAAHVAPTGRVKAYSCPLGQWAAPHHKACSTEYRPARLPP